MLIKLRCRSCFAKVSADDDLIGKEVNCPNCSFLFSLPKPQFGFGKILGGYEIEQWLGAGAMGEVYLARQVSMNRHVALKVVKHDINMDREVVDRFIHEAHVLASLNHSSIVPAFDAGHTDECYYMAMGFVDGETLEDKMRRKGRFEEIEALKICMKVTEALEYAWTEFKLLHRDIKPANIMIDSMKEIKIMDMGIAKNTNDDGGLTKVGLVVGTPFYMSPEQAQASTGIDFRSDVYALAATLYHMVTGILPFQGPNVMAILAKKVNFPLIPPNEINPEISEETSALTLKLLNYNPDIRVSSFDDLKKSLEKCLFAAEEKNKSLNQLSTKTAHLVVSDKLLEHLAQTRNEKKASKNTKNSKMKVYIGVLSALCLLLLLVLAFTGGKDKTPEVAVVKPKVELTLGEFLKTHLLFSWQALKKSDRGKVYSLRSANIGSDREMKLRSGAFMVRDQEQLEIDKIRKSKLFSLQVNFRTRNPTQKNAILLSFGLKENSQFSLMHNDSYLYVRYVDSAGKYHVDKLFKVGSHHRLTISYDGKILSVYDGGKLSKAFKNVSIDSEKWASSKLIVGNNSKEGRGWSGVVYGLGVFKEAMTVKHVASMIATIPKFGPKKQK